MQQGIRVCIGVSPTGDTDVFRIGAADDILRVLVEAHDTEFSISELVDITNVTRSTVWRAIDLLNGLDVLQIRETPQRKYISIDPVHLEKADPILGIKQEEFHEPVRVFVTEIQENLSKTDAVEQLVGIIVFGSVARGEADRKSDIDLFIVVKGDRTTARRRVADVVSDLRERRFNGDRFDFEQYVESIDSVERAGSKLQRIFDEGISVYGSDDIQSLRKVVFADE